MTRRHNKSEPMVEPRSYANWLFAAALVLAVLFVYQPAWQGGFIWDDDAHVTRPELRSWHGLYRIWFDVSSTMQYYPLLHTAFWIEHKLWGDALLGYHLVNIFLHATAALMAAVVLRRLAVPGAFLAAAIFALHPVHVESVAWITEQKNTLSAVFYLGALMLYLRFDESRKTWMYLGAFGLFILALLSKTVTGTLPGALLVIFWWQRGRLSWKRDVLPLLPFFLLGAGFGLITAWWELAVNNCVGPEFELTFVERILIAGRSTWFLLGKLFWPVKLCFIYPRWQIDSSVWWQYAYPLGALVLLMFLWAIRRRTRAPLAGLLFFGGTLFPVLGFLNLYTFLYSFVANHYQYLASLGIIALTSAGIALLLERWRLWGRMGGYVVCLTLLATLATLTWRQSRMYSDIITLYQTTIEINPNCWMAYNNLGAVLEQTGRPEEAIVYFEKALSLKPDFATAHCNLGLVLFQTGRPQEAIEHYQQALAVSPDFAKAQNYWGQAMVQMGRLPEAIEHYQQALSLKPSYPEVHNNLAIVLIRMGRFEEAFEHYRQALELRPDFSEAHYNLGNALIKTGRLEEAINHYKQAVRLKPDYVDALNNLGNALAETGRFQEAIEHFKQALRSKPDNISVYMNLSSAYASMKQSSQAIAAAEKGLELARSQEQMDAARRIEDWLNSYRASLSELPSGHPSQEPASQAVQ